MYGRLKDSHNVHGKWLPMDSKQHYVEPSPNDVAGVRIQSSRPGIMLTCIVSVMAIAPIVSEREGLQ